MSFDEQAINAIANAIDFIEDSLKEEIGIVDAAEAASYSLYHFCRLFNRYMHHSPYDYIIRRRLTEAAKELKTTNKQIIDIAFDFRFNSHETFSRAFKRFTGMQPNVWRKKGIHDRRFIFSRRTKEHLELIRSGIQTKPELIKRREFLFVGISSFIERGQDRAQSLWQTLLKELPLINNIIYPLTFYGINIYLDETEKDGIHYMAAVEVDSLDEVPPTLMAKRIPAGAYIDYSFAGSHQAAMDYLYQTYLAKAGKHPAYSLDIDIIGSDWQRIKSDGSVRKMLIPISESIMF